MDNENTKMKKKVNPRNFKIGTRIAISAICAIFIPIAILTPILSFLSYSISSYFDFSSNKNTSYSSMSLLQWNQSISTINNELSGINSDELKLANVKAFLSPIEQIGSKAYIEKNGIEFYSTSGKNDIIETSKNIATLDMSKNVHHFSEDGVLIVTHAITKDNDKFTLVIVNDRYVFNDSGFKLDENFIDLLFSRTGIIIIGIAIIFVISIIAFSIITSKTISVPIRKVANGANEIAKGNLDYKIDYTSTNEIGVLVNSFNDMSEQLKDTIESKEKVDNQRKETLAGIAHDLRTPLTSIKGYVEGLMDGIANTPEKQQRYLQTIYTSAVNTEKMLDDLLTISKLELGNIELTLRNTNASKFFDDCANDIKTELEKENFDFEYNNKCENDIIISIDADRFSRVIRNIISNSIKYSKPNVKGKIILDVASYEKSVIISIEDNGIGLENENLEKIFDSLYRADPARSKVSQGSGIGLAVCKQIVELHGGNIWATSEVNKGLTMHISLDRVVGDENEKNTNN